MAKAPAPRSSQRANRARQLPPRRATWPAVLVGIAAIALLMGIGAYVVAPRLVGIALGNRDLALNGSLVDEIQDGPAPTFSAAPPAPNEAEAVATIDGYFAALDREDWTSAAGATVGRANQLTVGIADQIQTRAARRNIEIDLEVAGQVDKVTDGSDDRALAETSFQVEATAQTFLGSITLIDTSGQTTMELVRTPDGVRISDPGTLWST